MKLKNKIGALTVALAMGAMALVGCGGDNPPAPDPGPGDIYYHVYPNSGQFTVSSFAEQGYKENDPVTFTVTPNEDYEVVSVVGSRGVGTLTPTAGQYSFSMPAGNVNLTITVREVEHYALSHTGDLQVDGDAVQFVLTLGSDVQPASSWTLEATSGASHVSIDATTKKVTALSATEEGEVVEFAAKVGGEVVGTDSAEVLPSLRSTIADAIADAWGDGTTAFANNNAKGSDAKSTKEYIITGKVMAFGNLNNGKQEAIIDDGTGLLDLQCLSVTASKPCPFALGDVVEVKNYLQNHYGLLEISCYPDTVSVVDKAITPKSTFPAISAEEYVSTLDNLSSTTEPRLIVDCSLVADGAPNGTSKRFDVEGVTSSKYNNGKMAASRGISGQELLCEEGVPYEFSGYLLNYNTSGKYSNLFPVTQELKAAESVAISNKAEVESMAINNEVQLTYTTVPANTGKVVVWESSKEEVVTVVDGLVSAVGAGTATVTLTVDGHSDSVEIEVSASITPVSTASFSKASEEVVMGSTLDLKELLTVGPEGANEKGTWSVEEGKESILSVANGVVNPLGKGTATVSVHYATNDVTASISVEVKIEHGKDVSDPLTVAEAYELGRTLPGQAYQQDVYSEDEWYIEAVVESITTAYSSSFQNFSFKSEGFAFERVSVEETAAVKGAYVIVKGYIHNYSNAYKVNVQKNGESAPAVVESDITKAHLVEISGSATVNQGETTTLTATVFPVALGLTVDTWEAGDAKVTVSNGVVTGVSAGISSVSASIGTGDDKVVGTFGIQVVYNREYVLAKQGLFGSGKTETQTGTGSYTATIEHTNSGFVVVTKNVNFGGTNYWDIGRFGRKSDESTAEIYTKAAVTDAIGKISINLTQADAADKVTGKVYTSTDGTNWTEVGSIAYAKGEQAFEFDTPTANLYYKISFICQATGSNGTGRFNQFNLYSVK